MKSIAFYLPQFYPIPENDQWWGKGFTEWKNVTKARPRFKGHYQPHLPADLGFYDLRVVETIRKQVELAKTYHMYGFCFYHYWFDGKTLLEKPLQLFVENEIDFPFCICWANQNWTRSWDGNESEVLLKQEYSEKDHRNHIRYLAANYFSTEQYIKIDEKPVFIVYRTGLFQDIKRTAEIWREEIRKLGFKGIYLVNVENHSYDIPAEKIGFDASIDFHPKGRNLPDRLGRNKFKNILYKTGLLDSVYYQNYVWDYREYVNHNLYENREDSTLYPCLFPMWDNSSRRENRAWIFHDSKPEYFHHWLEYVTENYKPVSEYEDFLFINAWNEWAEGCHLEPCQKWDRMYLEVIKKNISNPHDK